MSAAFSPGGTSAYQWFNSSSVTGWPALRIAPRRAAILLDSEKRSKAYLPTKNKRINPTPISTQRPVRGGGLRRVGIGGGVMAVGWPLRAFASCIADSQCLQQDISKEKQVR